MMVEAKPSLVVCTRMKYLCGAARELLQLGAGLGGFAASLCSSMYNTGMVSLLMVMP